MGVSEKGFAMPDGIAEVPRETGLGDRYRGELGTCSFRHLLRDWRLIVSVVVEREGESTNRRPGVTGHEGQHTARINPTAEVAADANIGPHSKADGLIQDGKELFCVFMILARLDGMLFGIIEIP